MRDPTLRILFCSEIDLRPELGAAKVLIELADALRAAGHTCELQGPDSLGMPQAMTEVSRVEYCRRLGAHLSRVGDSYDVVEYNHGYLPFARSTFPSDVLFVARSVLLAHYAALIRIPAARGLRASIGRMLRGRARQTDLTAVIARADQTLMNADLVNVCNYQDQGELARRGIDSGKVVVLPFGMNTQRRMLFDAVPAEPPSRPVVAFVGTFDYRKGAPDFPKIFERIRDAVPDAGLALFGTAGLLSTAEQVLSFFPRKLRPHVDVRPRFSPGELPGLLASCSVGIFPSYFEGFGFGVLEMLAAAIPVVAYDAPGPPMMLDRDRLVPPGDVIGMADKVIALLQNRTLLAAARAAARRSTAPFDWSRIALDTANVYAERLRMRRGQMSRVSVG